jgi:ribonuclease HI
MKVTIHIDGGARGNPGVAGAGIVLHCDGDQLLVEAGYYLGHQTNNVAEYTALLRALEAAKRAGATQLLIYSDSELLVRQINGEYRVRNAALKDLFDDAFGRLRGFEKWEVRHVRREQNSRADELANLAMDACADVVEIDNIQ